MSNPAPEPESFAGWDQYLPERPMVERVAFLIQFTPPNEHIAAWASYWLRWW